MLVKLVCTTKHVRKYLQRITISANRGAFYYSQISDLLFIKTCIEIELAVGAAQNQEHEF